jgi:hypothetical protein
MDLFGYAPAFGASCSRRLPLSPQTTSKTFDCLGGSVALGRTKWYMVIEDGLVNHLLLHDDYV